ncbi:hypothetical protein ASF43_13610 [Pseudorhodoferax sp. Leaf267]|nr:hypothetical protein ASF43_13610 [Pseudorhodoferax sp. Leaf267]
MESELSRLYGPRASGRAGDAVRAMVLELARPPSWDALGRVWHGVQAELELPAPAIAVNGTDGLQLWFSLAEPVAVARAQQFLQGLRQRFLPEIAPERVRLLLDAPAVPAEQGHSGNWSAFVAPDLAPVFADTPWLDIPPGEEGQANLLGVVASARPEAFDAAMHKLGPNEQLAASAGQHPATAPVAPGPGDDAPRRFLLQVMHDQTVPMALRIEAAKALLPSGGR